MIRPTKYLDLNTCLLNITAHVLAALRLNEVMKYDELLRHTEAVMANEDIRFDFPLALDFLYLLGRIEYFEDTDSLGILKPDVREARP